MTISSTNRKAGPFIGNGSTTVFPFSFKVFSSSDVYVVKQLTSSGVETVLTLNTDYTVALMPNQETSPGGFVTLSSSLGSGFTLVIASAVSELQPTNLTNQGGFYPSVINDSLDRATILVQQTKEKIDRSIKYPVTDASIGTEIPPSAIRARKVLSFDENGAPQASFSVADIQDASSFSNAAAASASAASTSASAASTSASAASTSASAASTSASSAAASATSAASYANAANAAVSFRNRVINGDFRIWQRGTGFAQNQYGYSADRFGNHSFGLTIYASLSNDAPSGFKNSNSVSGFNYPQTWQRIEATNCADMVGGSITVSFYAKHPSGGAGLNSLGVYLSYPSALDSWGGGTGTQFASATFAGTAGWVRYSTTFPAASIPAGVANGLLVSVYANTAGTGDFLVTGIQVEAGSFLTEFERRPYSVELGMAQRYYEIAPNLRVTNTSTSSQAIRATWQFKQEKRASPTVSTSGGVSAESISVRGVTLSGSTAAGAVFDAGTVTASAEL